MDEKPSRWNQMVESMNQRFGFETAQRLTTGIGGSGAEKLGTTLMEEPIERDGDVIASRDTL